MKDLVEYVIKSFVNNPDAVSVEEQKQDDGFIIYAVTVAPEDMGLVIGKGGQTIKSIRKLLTVRAVVEDQRVGLQLVEPGKTPQPVE